MTFNNFYFVVILFQKGNYYNVLLLLYEETQPIKPTNVMAFEIRSKAKITKDLRQKLCGFVVWNLFTLLIYYCCV